MPRLTPLNPGQLTPEQRAIVEALGSTSNPLPGPYEAWLRSPGLADVARRVGVYLRAESSLPRDLYELAIVVTARHWRAQFGFWAHARAAIEAGIAPAVIEAIRVGTPPPFARDVEREVFDFVREYLATSRVSDDTYRSTVETFGEQGVVDLVGTVGYFCLVTMTLNVFEVPVPEGEPLPLE